NPVYQVGRKSFVFFRNPRPDAVDPGTGERYPDVIVIWVPSQADKLALVQDERTPFFTTRHFDGHLSVLVRGSQIGELTLAELAEVIQDAWLCRASARRAKDWLQAHADDRVRMPRLGATSPGAASCQVHEHPRRADARSLVAEGIGAQRGELRRVL